MGAKRFGRGMDVAAWASLGLFACVGVLGVGPAAAGEHPMTGPPASAAHAIFESLDGPGGRERPRMADGCAAACYGEHNQCRIQSKGAPGCDAALTSCLRGCTKR